MRYVSAEYEQKEAFLGFFDAYSLTESDSLDAKTLCEIIIKIVSRLKLNTDNMVSVCTDGANLLAGKDAGCVKLLQKHFDPLIYTVCYAHSLNLCINASLKAPSILDCCGYIEKAVSFFNYPKRAKVLVEANSKLNKPDLKLIDPSPTRQIQRLEAIHRMKELYPSVIESFNIVFNWSESAASESALKLIRKLSTKDFALSLASIEFFLTKLRPVATIFQIEKIDIKSARRSLANLISDFRILNRESLARSMVEEANKLTKDVKLYAGFMQNRSFATPAEYCKVRIIDPIIDGFIEIVDVKFSKEELLVAEVMSDFKNSSIEKILEIGMRYKQVIDNKCEVTFYRSRLISEIEEVQKIKFDPNDTFLRISKNISSTYKYVSDLFAIGASIWVSTSTAERSFSKLKLIKQYLRTTMKQERLSNCAVISMNSDITIQTDEIVDKFLSVERKVNFN